MQAMPYFMENDDWYYVDDKKDNKYGGHLFLTELGKSIPAVVKSYEEFIAPEYDEDGDIVDS